MKESKSVRIGLTHAEYEQLREKADRTGISLARLMADAVRAVHLGKTGLGDARGVRSGGES